LINRVPSIVQSVPGVVVIPAKNEQGSVGDVVRDVTRFVDWETVVVDDASVDDTRAEAEESGARVLTMPFQVGAWGAVQAGMRYALDEGYGLCLTMDADGQHPAEALPAVTAPVIRGACDVAIGVCPERASKARHVAWAIFRCITGLNLRDVTSGLRAYNTAAMRVLACRQASMLNYQDVGVLLMLRDAGIRAAEVKVAMDIRHNGCSRVYDSWWTVARYFAETFMLSVGKWRASGYRNKLMLGSLSADEQ